LEYALILPFLLLLTFSIVEGGLLFFRYNTVANAAREGARAGIVPVTTGCGTTCIEGKASAAALALTSGLLPAPAVDVDLQGANPVTIAVTVNYTSKLIFGPLVEAIGAPGEIELSATATMQRE
jgi:Flp pilus assembly protein TadG